MTVTSHSDDLRDNRPIPDALIRRHQQNVASLNGAMKLALDGAQTSVDRYNEIVSEAHRRFAVLMWRGTLPLRTCNEESSALEIAQRAINTAFVHAAALAEIAATLQLESLDIFQRSALNSLNLISSVPK
jgi:hypothetical protein